MVKRLTTGWTIFRALYVVMGVTVIGQAATQHQWLGILFGAYFASMGLFSFGCASGNCYVPTTKAAATNNATEEITYEEIK